MKSIQLFRHARGGQRFHSSVRRGAAVVQVAVFLTTLIGFAALAIDVGLLYNERADLQKTADAAALAAAAELGDYSQGDPLDSARTLATAFSRD